MFVGVGVSVGVGEAGGGCERGAGVGLGRGVLVGLTAPVDVGVAAITAQVNANVGVPRMRPTNFLRFLQT